MKPHFRKYITSLPSPPPPPIHLIPFRNLLGIHTHPTAICTPTCRITLINRIIHAQHDGIITLQAAKPTTQLVLCTNTKLVAGGTTSTRDKGVGDTDGVLCTIDRSSRATAAADWVGRFGAGNSGSGSGSGLGSGSRVAGACDGECGTAWGAGLVVGFGAAAFLVAFRLCCVGTVA